MDITINVHPQTLIKLIQHCTNSGDKLIIGMDSNAHSVLWGNETNNRGEWLEELILDSNLTVENKGTKPTFIARQTSTTIDITLTLNIELNNWKVTDEVTFSDHAIIRFNLNLTEPKAIKTRNLNKIDWFQFRSKAEVEKPEPLIICLLYTSPSPRDRG